MTKRNNEISVRTLPIDIYESEIHFIIGPNQTKLLDYVEDTFFIVDDDENFDGKLLESVRDTDLKKSIYPILFVADSLDMSVFGHELNHALKRILTERNIRCGEAEAYLTGYATKSAFNLLKPFIQDLL